MLVERYSSFNKTQANALHSCTKTITMTKLQELIQTDQHSRLTAMMLERIT